MEHRGVLHRPRLDFFAAGTIHQHRQAFVDRGRQLGVTACAEDGRGAGVRVDAGEVLGGQRKASLRVVEFGYAVKIEGAIGRVFKRRWAGNKDAKLEGRMNVGKENFLVLEIIQARNRPSVATP